MKRFFASLLLAVAVLLAAVAISLFIDAARGTDVSSSIGGAGMCVAFALLAGINALRLFRPSASKRPSLSLDEEERLALGCAASLGGKLTEVELSLAVVMSLDRARRTLESLAKHGIAEIEVSSSGALVYGFPGLISTEEKMAAKPVEDA